MKYNHNMTAFFYTSEAHYKDIFHVWIQLVVGRGGCYNTKTTFDYVGDKINREYYESQPWPQHIIYNSLASKMITVAECQKYLDCKIVTLSMD